jgi:HK97 family phage prohead protease
MAEHAVKRNDVNGLLLCINSPGGDSSSMLECAEYIYSLRTEKPVIAVADDQCYSAAFCIGSAASKLYVTRTGGVGSVGVWTMHASVQRALQQSGVDVTVISAGRFKTDGSPFGPLSDHARADLENECARLRGLFVSAVSQFRECDQASIYQTEAACLMGDAGVPLMADGVVSSAGEVLDYLQARTKRTYLFAGRPEYTDGSSAALIAPSSRQLTTGRTTQNNSELLTLEDAAGRVTTYTNLDLQNQMSHPSGSTLTTEHKLSVLTKLQTLKQRYPQAIAVQRTFKRAAQVSTERTINLLPVPYGPDCYADLGAFIERYRPGAFRSGLDGDIHFHYCHGDTVQHVLGRTLAGTAKAWEASDGVHGTCDVARTPIGDTVLEGLRRGDLSGSSAGFFIIEQSWSKQEDGTLCRWVEKAVMNDMSVEPYPAYKSATASLGSQATASVPRTTIENHLRLIKAQMVFAPAWKQNELRKRQIELMRQRVEAL